MATADRAPADGRLAIFAIVKRPTPTTVSLLGTGFYLQPNGAFATAAHVAVEARQLMGDRSRRGRDSPYFAKRQDGVPTDLEIFHSRDCRCGFRSAALEFVDNQTGAAFRSKILSINSAPPALGSPISTWSYPLHTVLGEETTGQSIQLQPTFYDGVLQEVFTGRGPSAKLAPPYFQTNISLHGGSSGGPVFNPEGEVFGIASCSYDGAEDIAFVTPVSTLLEIEIPERIGVAGDGERTVSLRELAVQGRIMAR